MLQPAHTPDGSPCGLLSHLTAPTQVLTHPSQHSHAALLACLAELGMLPQRRAATTLPANLYLPVLLDGLHVGSVPLQQCPSFCSQLRMLKVQRSCTAVPWLLEIYAQFDMSNALYPCIVLYTSAARVMRPVVNLCASVAASNKDADDAKCGTVEWIGSHEAITLEIALTAHDFRLGETTHQELSPVNMFSVVASCTPFSDFNQSPRNMYRQLNRETAKESVRERQVRDCCE